MQRLKSRELNRSMQRWVSWTLLLAALVAILIPGFDSATKLWAFGLTAAILGFWLPRR